MITMRTRGLAHGTLTTCQPGRRGARHDRQQVLQLLGRAGLAAYGLVHFTIAYLAVVGSGTGAVLLAGALVALLIAV